MRIANMTTGTAEHLPVHLPSRGPALRPKDAATLIVLRRDGDAPRVLMGKRHEGHKFMPGKFVFPGGRVDPADSRVAPLTGLDPAVEARLLERMRGRPSPGRARGLAMAALRETFEEAGLVIGAKADAPPRSAAAGWREFLLTGIQPTLHHLRYVTRAITPPGRTRRFDTRFFVAEAEHVMGDLHDLSGASEELLELHWLTFDEARGLEVPNITSIVLTELEARLDRARGFDPDEPVPFYYMRGKQFRREVL
jgi:8-oxo-dGTP pyrophosphatase MutT (NUDIX family)